MSQDQAQAHKPEQENKDLRERDKQPQNKELMGHGRGHLDKKLYDFEDYHIPPQGEYKEVRNEVYVNMTVDKDGRQKFERTFDRSVAHARDGQLIAERRQRYEDDSGMQKETHEKQLDKKGVKQISERNERGEWKTKYQNRNVENPDDFYNEWQSRNDKMTRPLQLRMWDHFPQLL